MKNQTLAIVIALIIAGVFLSYALRPGAFNLIGYSIHEAIWPGGANESNFIRVFDIVCGIIIFWIAYKILIRILKVK